MTTSQTLGPHEDCTQGHACNKHGRDHEHGTDCGHEAVSHEDHTDYKVGTHLHNAHSGHCDNHGPIV